MKKAMLSIAVLLAATLASAQTRNVTIEAFGAQNTVGLNYDTRLKGNCGWGYRLGLGYCYSGRSNMLGSSSIKGVAAPVELNYLLGQKKSKLELGFGASLGYYKEKYDVWHVKPVSQSEDTPYYETYATQETRKSLGYYLFGNIGYRLQPAKGFVLRIGVTPSFNFGDSHGIERSTFYPYLAFGLAF